jgi:hypothetical protein
MMVSAQQVAELAGSLGTAGGLARVNTGIKSLSQDMMDSKKVFSRDELAQMIDALDSLSAAILSMDRVTRELLGQSAGAVDCVG